MPELQPPEFTIESMRNMTWDDKLLTPLGGFLRIEREDGSFMGGGVSMFHHLHCLIMVRDMLTGRPMDDEFEAGGELHWAHCLEREAEAAPEELMYVNSKRDAAPEELMYVKSR